jgi:regulatory protein
MSPQATAKESALRYLSIRDHSCAEMRRKLARKGIAAEVIEGVIAGLAKSGLLDDDRYGHRLALALAREKRLGPRATGRKLLQKGIAAEVIAKALEEAAEACPVPDRLRQTLRGRLKGRDPAELPLKEKRKLFQYLLRHGFPWEDVAQALQERGGYTEE